MREERLRPALMAEVVALCSPPSASVPAAIRRYGVLTLRRGDPNQCPGLDGHAAVMAAVTICALAGFLVNPHPRAVALEEARLAAFDLCALKALTISRHSTSHKRPAGLEPANSAWKADMLPLHHGREIRSDTNTQSPTLKE
jgi:hypothetical protein